VLIHSANPADRRTATDIASFDANVARVKKWLVDRKTQQLR